MLRSLWGTAVGSASTTNPSTLQEDDAEDHQEVPSTAAPAGGGGGAGGGGTTSATDEDVGRTRRAQSHAVLSSPSMDDMEDQEDEDEEAGQGHAGPSSSSAREARRARRRAGRRWTHSMPHLPTSTSSTSSTSSPPPFSSSSACSTTPTMTLAAAAGGGGGGGGGEEVSTRLMDLLEEAFEQLQDEADEIPADPGASSSGPPCWRFVKEDLGVRVSRKTLDHSPVNCMRGDADLPCSAQEFRQLVLQAERWAEWDIFAASSRVVRDLHSDGIVRTCIAHITYSAPWPLNSRDVCVIMSSREYDDGTVAVVARSVTDNNCPEVSGTVRAELLSSGYIITPRDEGGIHVTYILQIDFKGRIPSMISGMLGTEMPKSISRIGKCILRDRDQLLQRRKKSTSAASE